MSAAVRLAASDFAFNTWRFIGANVVFGAGLILVFILALGWPPGIALLPLLAVPLAGMHRMAALLARGEPASLSDFGDGMRRFGVHAVGIAAAELLAGIVLTTNALAGFMSGEPIGWFVGALAVYGLVALAMFAVAAWPLVVDPEREAWRLRERLRAAALLVVARPGRLFVLTLLIAVLLVASTLLLGGIVLVAASFASLVATRWVLPAADGLAPEASHLRVRVRVRGALRSPPRYRSRVQPRIRDDSINIEVRAPPSPPSRRGAAGGRAVAGTSMDARPGGPIECRPPPARRSRGLPCRGR